jgi:hypothetical protein
MPDDLTAGAESCSYSASAVTSFVTFLSAGKLCGSSAQHNRAQGPKACRPIVATVLTSLLCDGLESVSTAQRVRPYCDIKLVCLRNHCSAPAAAAGPCLLQKGAKAGAQVACCVRRTVKEGHLAVQKPYVPDNLILLGSRTEALNQHVQASQALAVAGSLSAPRPAA